MRIMRIRYVVVPVLLGLVMVSGCQSAAIAGIGDLKVPENVVGRVVIFGAGDCSVCAQVNEDVITPLQERCGSGLEVKSVDIGTPEGYEAFVAAETALVGEPGRWEIPAVLVADTAFVGESAIREGLLPHLKCVFGAGGNDWPDIASLAGIPAQPTATPDTANPFVAVDAIESCVDDEASAVCEAPSPIFALYLSASQCEDTCERTRYDLTYLKGVYPQLSFEERSIEDSPALVEALGMRLGLPEGQRLTAPTVVVGDDYLSGEDVDLESLRALVGANMDSGAMAIWYTLDLP